MPPVGDEDGGHEDQDHQSDEYEIGDRHLDESPVDIATGSIQIYETCYEDSHGAPIIQELAI
jgi:hypothetical protein